MFASPEEAEAVAARLLDWMQAIVAWRKQNNLVDADGFLLAPLDGPPAPAETALAEELGVAWVEHSVDWVWMNEDVPPPVTAIDRLVMIDGQDSEQGAYPADALLRKLGGQVAVKGSLGDDGQPRAVARLNLTCLAADEEAAEMIERAFQRYLSQQYFQYDPITSERRSFHGFETPWHTFVRPGYQADFSGQLTRAGRQLTIAGGEFDDLVNGFAALLAYLRAWGCSDIVYDFYEVNATDGGG